mgnify:CR=1 FL=1
MLGGEHHQPRRTWLFSPASVNRSRRSLAGNRRGRRAWPGVKPPPPLVASGEHLLTEAVSGVGRLHWLMRGSCSPLPARSAAIGRGDFPVNGSSARNAGPTGRMALAAPLRTGRPRRLGTIVRACSRSRAPPAVFVPPRPRPSNARAPGAAGARRRLPRRSAHPGTEQDIKIACWSTIADTSTSPVPLAPADRQHFARA